MPQSTLTKHLDLLLSDAFGKLTTAAVVADALGANEEVVAALNRALLAVQEAEQVIG